MANLPLTKPREQRTLAEQAKYERWRERVIIAVGAPALIVFFALIGAYVSENLMVFLMFALCFWVVWPRGRR